MWYYCVACTEIRPGYAEPFNCARCFSCFLEEHECIIPPKSNRMAGCGRLIPDGLTVAELDKVWYDLREKENQGRNIHSVR